LINWNPSSGKTCKKQDRQSCSTEAAVLLEERFVNTKLRISILFFGLVLSILYAAGLFAEEKELKMEKSLSTRQEKAAAIAAFTANGDINKLKRVLNEGLDSGLTVNEIGEILLQMYAYASFPRSLNGINTLSSVLEERKAKGIEDPSGTEPDRLPENTDKYALGASNLDILIGFPMNYKKAESNGYNEAMDAFLKEHLFADIFGRNILSFQMRELATVAALCSLEGTNQQLMFHINAAMNCKISEEQMRELVEIIGKELGAERRNNAESVFFQVLKRRKNIDKKNKGESCEVQK